MNNSDYWYRIQMIEKWKMSKLQGEKIISHKYNLARDEARITLTNRHH